MKDARPTPRQLFERALDLPVAEREASIRRWAGNNKHLVAETCELLKSFEQAGDFLPNPTVFLPLESSPDLKPWSQVGPYTILDLLGRGNFAAVYWASQERPLKREVALKLLDERRDGAECLERYERERDLLSRLDHPGIARVLDAGLFGERPYVVMELIQGKTLLEGCQDLSVEQRLRLFVQIAHAVEHAHRRGVLHLDLKPSNVLVDEVEGEPRAKIIDFGIARAVSEVGDAPIAGTPAYMAPEQLEGDELDTRTDVHGLGAILCALLTGESPFIGDSTAERVDAIRRGARRPMNLDVELSAILGRALAAPAIERYPSAADLAHDIEAYLAGEPVAAVGGGPFYRGRLWARRNRTLSASLTLGLVLLGVLGALAWDGAADARRERQQAEGVLEFLQGTLGSGNPWAGSGTTHGFESLLEDARARIASAELSPVILGRLQLTIAGTWLGRGEPEEARHSLEAALETLDDPGEVYLARWLLSDALFQLDDPGRIEAGREACEARDRWFAESGLDLTGDPIAAVERELARVTDASLRSALIDHLTDLALESMDSDPAGSRRLFVAACDLLEAEFGADHPEWGLNQTFLGEACLADEADKAALAAFERGLVVLNHSLHVDHPQRLAARSGYGEALHHMGRIRRAETVLEETLHLARARFGEEHGLVQLTLERWNAVRRE